MFIYKTYMQWRPLAVQSHNSFPNLDKDAFGGATVLIGYIFPNVCYYILLFKLFKFKYNLSTL